MAEIINSQQLPEFVRLPLTRFVDRLIKIHEGNVTTVAVYGSIASQNFIPRVSDVNVVVIVKDMRFSVLKSSLELVKWGQAYKINAPLFLTEEYISRSLDVFPIEFLEMKDFHITLYGREVFKEITVNTVHLRLFCEQQIKGKLLRVRQAYLEKGLDPRAKLNLIYDAQGSLMPVFTNLLRLRRLEVPSAKSDILKLMREQFGVNDALFTEIYKDRQARRRITSKSADDYLDSIIQQLEKLAVMIDYEPKN